jgi:hypothetical protein
MKAACALAAVQGLIWKVEELKIKIELKHREAENGALKQ